MGSFEYNIAVKSVNVSHIAYFNSTDFFEVIKRYKHDYEKFCMLRD